MKIDAEDTRKEYAVGHFELPELHIPEQLVDNRLAAEPILAKALPTLRHRTSPPYDHYGRFPLRFSMH